MADGPTIIAKLDELLAVIRGYDDPRRAGGEWKQVYKLLQNTDLPGAGVTHVVGMRDVVRLAGLIEELRSPASESAQPTDAPDADTCKRALRAFRRRRKLTLLDDESKINSHSPLTKGADSHAATAIAPPDDWPESVWQELVRQGKLRYIGHGCYDLTKQ